MLLKLLTAEPTPAATIADPKWVKTKRGGYHRLLTLLAVDMAALSGIGGVYAIWHKGARPGWVYVGSSDDLATSLREARDTPAILNLESRGGLYVTWSPVVVDFRPRVVKFLKQTCAPLVTEPLPCDDPDIRAVAMPVKLPG